jgi:exodeoxyribonuclease III
VKKQMLTLSLKLNDKKVMSTTHIVSYNLNGIRAAVKKDLIGWLKTIDCDIFCVQETKADIIDIPVEGFEELGYNMFAHAAEKKGYSGVATFTKRKPDYIEIGCGMPKYDSEGRILRTDFGDLTLLNCYFPSGTTGDIRQDFKMEFLADFYQWVHELRKLRPNLIIVGDYNIAHHEIDIHNPKGNKNSSGFLPDERAWLSQWFESGFVDAFRHCHPEKVEYSWWSARFNSRASNKGWRIDYQSVSQTLSHKIVDAGQYHDAVHSDHCPVWLRLK